MSANHDPASSPAAIPSPKTERGATGLTGALLTLLPALLAAAAGAPVAAADIDYTAAQKRMVEQQLIPSSRGITHPAVLKAMATVPRHEFVPAAIKRHAYVDQPLPIGYGQTISQPYVVAFMTEKLAPRETDRVLEIGTGSGYQAAILSGLVREVYSIEIVEPLAKRAAGDLARLGYSNVSVRHGDGYPAGPRLRLSTPSSSPARPTTCRSL
jgi:protein-L-isoaspartate(D-aspartate) O-methyltransferase